MNSRLTIAQIYEQMTKDPDTIYLRQEIVDATHSHRTAVVHMALLLKLYELWKNKSKELNTDGWFYISNKDLCSRYCITIRNLSRHTKRLVDIGVIEKKRVHLGQSRGTVVYYRFPKIAL